MAWGDFWYMWHRSQMCRHMPGKQPGEGGLPYNSLVLCSPRTPKAFKNKIEWNTGLQRPCVCTFQHNLNIKLLIPQGQSSSRASPPPPISSSVLRKIAPVSTTTTSGKSAAGGGSQTSRGKSATAPGSAAADGKASALSATAKPYVPAPAASGRGGSSSASSAATKQSGSQAGKRQQANSGTVGGGQVVKKEPASSAAAATTATASGVAKRAREGGESARLKPAKTARVAVAVAVGEQELGEIVSEKKAPVASSAGGGEVRLSVLFCSCLKIGELAARTGLGCAKSSV